MQKIYYRRARFNGQKYKIVREYDSTIEGGGYVWALYDNHNKYLFNTIVFSEISDYLDLGVISL